MQFNVPQFLEVEDKVVGPLTLKQFGYLAAGGAVLFLVYNVAPSFIAFLFVAVPISALAIALAFIRINGQPFVHTIYNFCKYLINPKLFVWRKK